MRFRPTQLLDAPHRLLLLGGQLGPGAAAQPGQRLAQSTVAEAAIRSAGVVDSRSRAAASAVSARWNGTRYTAGMVPPSIPGTGSRITPSAAASSARQARTRSAGTPRICAASVGDPAGGPRPDPLDQPRAEVALDALDGGRQHRGVRLDLNRRP